MKTLVFALAALAASILFAPAWAATVKMVKIASETEAYSVDIEYPQIGVKPVDDEIAAWAKARADDVVRAARGRQPGQGQFMVAIAANVVRNDSEMFEVVFDASTDMGFGHPENTLTSMNYLMPEGTRVLLAEALQPGGFKRIADLAVPLIKTEATPDVGGPPDPEMLKISTAPYPENFRTFAFTPTDLILYFAARQISTGVVDSITVRIPRAKLADVLRADWRQPLPGFDCAKAATNVEKAICADRALARLDRQVSEEYAHVLRNAELMGKPVPEIKAAQRAFIDKRNKDCEKQAFGQITQCLTAAYTPRLAALKRAFE